MFICIKLYVWNKKVPVFVASTKFSSVFTTIVNSNKNEYWCLSK